MARRAKNCDPQELALGASILEGFLKIEHH
jgi:hypothetical protein